MSISLLTQPIEIFNLYSSPLLPSPPNIIELIAVNGCTRMMFRSYRYTAYQLASQVCQQD